MSGKRASHTFTRIAQVIQPHDANILGKVFGGAILSLIDSTASATAAKFSGMTCVTASMDQVDFHEPIDLGELVTLEAVVTYVGRTSVEVTVEVFATNIIEDSKRHTNTARVIMVAVDDDGKPTPVPELICETRDEKLHYLRGALRRSMRSERRQLAERVMSAVGELSDERLDEVLADPVEFEELRSSLGW